MYNWHPQMGRQKKEKKNIRRNYNNGVNFSKADEKYNPTDLKTSNILQAQKH